MSALLLARRLVVACSLALACAGVRAAEPFILAGHELGMPYDPVLKDARYDCESLAGCFLYTVCQYKPPDAQKFAGVPADRISLYFQGERLSGIEAEFPADQFDAVASALAREYGQATDEPAKSGKGDALIWRQAGQLLRIERDARPGRSSVIVAERGFIGELIQR